ncbi:MAG: LacI family transcriptional regulator [Actinotalea sp.]|nr:LacI family transcriptional regulator [Actinotalea sp.]
MPKRPTVYDVAQEAGVSIATVSFTFRRPSRVKATTRATVLEAARRLNYVPSANARGLAHGRTGALGLYSFDMFLERAESGDARPVQGDPGPFFGPDVAEHAFADDADAEDFRVFPLYVDEIQRGFEVECARRGRVLLIGSGPSGDGSGFIDIASRVDGLAVFPGAHSEEIVAQLSHRLPVVAFAMPYGAGTLHHVRVDNQGGVEALTDHLVLDHGITDVQFVGAPEMTDYQERFEGMRAALSRHGLAVPDAVLDPTPLVDDQPYAVVRTLADEGRLPGALVCASDQHALALLDVLAASGIEVPRDVAVTGFDGVVAGRLSTPALTTVRQPMEAMGRLAVDILMDALDEPGGVPVDRTLPVRTILRRSCGCSGS